MKNLVKKMYMPLEDPLDETAVQNFVTACSGNRKLSTQAAVYIRHKITGSAYEDQQVKTGYLLLHLLTSYEAQLPEFIAELNQLGFAQMPLLEFQSTSAINTLNLINLRRQPRTAQNAEEIVSRYVRLVRAITGFTSGLTGYDDTELNLEDIRGSLVFIGLQRITELIAFLEEQRETLDFQKFKPELSDLTLCMNQLSDFMHEIGKVESEMADLQNQIRAFFTLRSPQQTV